MDNPKSPKPKNEMVKRFELVGREGSHPPKPSGKPKAGSPGQPPRHTRRI